MQSLKSIVVAGCLLLAVTPAFAQYGSEYDNYGAPDSFGYGQVEPPRSGHSELRELRNWMDREQERYEQNLPAIREREGRGACDAIQGNEAARADCYRGYGGW